MLNNTKGKRQKRLLKKAFKKDPKDFQAGGRMMLTGLVAALGIILLVLALYLVLRVFLIIAIVLLVAALVYFLIQQLSTSY